MVRSVHQIAKMSHRQSARSACGGGSILHRKLELVCGAKWKRPVKRVYGIGRKGNGAICAPNRQNESSPIGSIGLWSGLHFAPQTSTTVTLRSRRRGDGNLLDLQSALDACPSPIPFPLPIVVEHFGPVCWLHGTSLRRK